MNRSVTNYFFCLSALLLNIGFLVFLYDPAQFFSISHTHANIGTQIAQQHTFKINTHLAQALNDRAASEHRLINVNEIDTQHLPTSQEAYAYFPINDTIGYGIILALLWKLTGSFSFTDVQILQIILFALLIMSYMQLVSCLFGNRLMTSASTVSLLLFFPLSTLTVQPARDIWAYYGIVLLATAVGRATFGAISYRRFCVYTIGYAMCQWIRPTIFTTLLGATIFLLFCYLTGARMRRTQLCVYLLLMYSTNIIFFWTPFIVHNTIAYNTWIVGPVGQDLLEGLGEFDNPWGFKLSDHWLKEYIESEYGYTYGTVAFDRAAHTEFIYACKQDRWFYPKTLIWRIKQIVLPGLPWLESNVTPVAWQTRLVNAIDNHLQLIRILFDLAYIRMYLIIGYIGFALMLWDKKYRQLLFIFLCIIAGGLGKFPSHIEYRYLVPAYWAFALGVGYLSTYWHRQRIR